ncbi:response regulator [Geotalea toluenoxydans]|uniref:response regulator n=1 Tax=Geotalea toluenoxydans TaxID=421624 RepID=UPI0006D28645|nr:response regulator [Geotalea toluenoxydans]
MKRILLVEDNPDDEALTLRALQKVALNDEIVIARDGVEALDIAFGRGQYGDGDGSNKPRLILLDLKLPKVDGLEVLRQLRANSETRTIPIVVFTSSSEELDILHSYCLGANSYIRKPVEFSQFCDALRQISGYWLSLCQLPPQIDCQR